ncbi:effector-associated domain EAD1-containing protein [Streptomyces sp. NPDC102476]|uniref:effector-associated domain EAD1-containing protein n=1 Tax=Streptomyces sp. NPDC102476 TaxID=3366181 RepID=UPI003830265F
MVTRRDVWDVLADLFTDEAEIQLLLEPLGIDLTRLPPVRGGTARTFWFTTCRKIDNGAFPATRADLVEAAANEFPNNRQLRDFLEASRSAPPVGDSPDSSGSSDSSDSSDSSGSELPDPTRILCLLSAPQGPAPLRQSAEFRAIQEALTQGQGRRLELHIRTAARNRDVIPALLTEKPHILHFAGHGSPNGYLLMEDDHGRVAPVRADWLNEALEASGGVHTLVLAACHLGRQLKEFRSGSTAAIGCDEPLCDADAIAFSRDFYGALSHGKGVAEAFALGKAGVQMAAGSARGLNLDRGAPPPPEEAAG